MAAAESWEDADLSGLSLTKAVEPRVPVSRPTGRPGSLEAAVADRLAAAAEEALDGTLREALQRGGSDRETALRFDAECERLLRSPRQAALELPGPLNPFHRLLARKVALHYGMGCEATAGEGVCLFKTPAGRGPPSRLQDVPLASASDAGEPGGSQQQQPARVVGVMRRTGSGGAQASGLGLGGAAQPQPPKSVEEREAEYERARERILGSSDGAAGGAPSLCATEAPPATGGAGGASAPPLEDASAPQPQQSQQQPGARHGVGGGAPRALMRDREKDLADPDFRRRSGGAYGQAQGYGMGYVAAGFGQEEFPALGAAAAGAPRWSNAQQASFYGAQQQQQQQQQQGDLRGRGW